MSCLNITSLEMNYVQIFNKKNSRIARLFIGSDNILKREYLNGCFPGAIGIFFVDEELDQEI